MGWIVAFGLLLVAFSSYKAADSWWSPAPFYSSYWALIVATTMVSASWKGGLSLDALLVFLVGCIMFSVGSLTAVFCLDGFPKETRMSEGRKAFIQKCIACYSAGLLLLIPLFVGVIQTTASTLGIEQFPLAARWALQQSDRAGIPRYFVSLSSIGSMLTFYTAWLYSGTRKDKIVFFLSLGAALLINALTFSRTRVATVIIGVAAIMAFRRTVRMRTIVSACGFAGLLTLILGAFLGKGPDFESGESLLVGLAESFAVYVVGGPVGFSQVMDDPGQVGESGISLRFFTQIAESLGFDVDVPTNVLGYFSEEMGNVYTFYFAYWLDWGWTGVIVASLISGMFSTAVFVFAQRGNPVAGVAVGLVFASLINTPSGDGLLGSAVPWLLLWGIVWCLWRFPLQSEKVPTAWGLAGDQGGVWIRRRTT